MTDGDGKWQQWDSHIRTLSNVVRDVNFADDLASDPAILNAVRNLYAICKDSEPKSVDMAARVYPQLNKLFQRSISSISTSKSSYAQLLLAILQFFLDFGEMLLHDADTSLRAYFRSCLSREFADPVAAEGTLKFLHLNNRKLAVSFSTILTQFFPLLLKLVVWHGEKLEKQFLQIFPIIISPASFLPLFPALIDFPVLSVALERVERSSGSLIGSNIASMQKSAAPEMLFALMDEAYTGSTIGDAGVDSEYADDATVDIADPFFLELLKDENDGLAERHWTSPSISAAIHTAVAGKSDRLSHVLRMTPRILKAYFDVALRDANDALICALIPLIMERNDKLFPDTNFSYEVRRRILEFILAAFQRSPSFIPLLKKPIMNMLGEAYDSPAKTELAIQLCWAIGEHGGGGASHKDTARELFEALELLLYENLSSSRLGAREPSDSGSETHRKVSQSRLLCFVVTAIAKLATCHHELLPRARVSLGKVARSRQSDGIVWRRACDYLGLLNEPGICTSVLGPCGPVSGSMRSPGTVDWNEGRLKMLAHVPFYVLGAQEGPPYHDFCFKDIIPTAEVPSTTERSLPI